MQDERRVRIQSALGNNVPNNNHREMHQLLNI